MKIEIDQSGRIEYTSKPTILAFSNSKFHSIIISSSEKQYLQRVYRKAGKTKILMIKTFAVMVFLLIKDQMTPADEIVIDREYDGYDKQIKHYLDKLIEKEGVKIDVSKMHFKNIGKKSLAHNIAINSFRKKRADKRIYAGDILKIVM